MLLRRDLLWSIPLGFLRELFSVWKLWWEKRQRGTSKNSLHKEWSFLLPNLTPYRLQNLASAFFLVACSSRRNVLVWRLLYWLVGLLQTKNEERFFFFRMYKLREAKHFWSSLKLLCTSNCWHFIPYSCIYFMQFSISVFVLFIFFFIPVSHHLQKSISEDFLIDFSFCYFGKKFLLNCFHLL